MTDNPDLIAEIRTLPMPGTSFDQLQNLATRLARQDAISGTPLDVRVIGSITVDYLIEFLRLALVRWGMAPRLSAAPFGTLVASLMNAAVQSAADITLLIPSHRDLLHAPDPGCTAQQARDAVAREVAFWLDLVRCVNGPVVLLGFDQPGVRILGELDTLRPGGRGWHIRMTNLGLAETLPINVNMIDAEALQARVGQSLWPDARIWQLCKQPFAMEALPEIANTMGAAIAAITGRARKVLVLDLDNTLWGGIVGDDGVEGLELGPETAEGEAFLALQDYARRLRQRGVLLAVCSKNREEAARAPFRNHPAMILREEDIACFVANFDDKPSNLREIARALNLGLDSLVFADDNPVERALVRAELPDVLVVELPEDPAGFVAAIEAVQAFPVHSITHEDLTRSASYRALAQAAVQRASTTDLDGFLQGLAPVLHIDRVDAASVPRIAQLLAKTNQFRMNASRFDEAALLARPGDILALRLADRLQDYGIVAVVVLQDEGEVLRVENWVMSCRVFSRRLEHATLALLRARARMQGASRIVLAYVPTAKNVILPPVLAELGFSEQGAPNWLADANGQAVAPDHMVIIDHRSEETNDVR